MNQRRSADAATVLAAVVVLIVGLTAVAFGRGCRFARPSEVTARSGLVAGRHVGRIGATIKVSNDHTSGGVADGAGESARNRIAPGAA